MDCRFGKRFLFFLESTFLFLFAHEAPEQRFQIVPEVVLFAPLKLHFSLLVEHSIARFE